MARIAATTHRLTTFCRMAIHQTRAFQHVLALCDNWSCKILLGTSKPLKSIFSTWPSASQIGPLKYFCWGLCSSFVLWPFSCWFLTIWPLDRLSFGEPSLDQESYLPIVGLASWGLNQQQLSKKEFILKTDLARNSIAWLKNEELFCKVKHFGRTKIPMDPPFNTGHKFYHCW